MGIMAQIGIVLAVCLVGEGIAALLPIPFPASVISMVLLFLLLATKLLRPHHIKEKSNFLITNMACFFCARRRGYPALCGCAVGQPAAAAGHLLHHHAAGVRRYGLGRAAHHARHSEKGGPS